MKNGKVCIEALKGVIEAWESLDGGYNYSPTEIESWLVNDMKPAIGKARKVVKEYGVKE